MPLPLTVSCSSKIQIGFTFLVPAYPGCPGKEAVKWLLLLLLLGAVAEWLVSWTQAQKARVQIAATTLLGNSLRQTAHTHRASPSSKIGSSPLKGCGGNCRPGGK